MGIKGRLTLVDDDQPGPGHEGFFGHLGGRRDHQTGPHHNKQITFARMLKRQRKVFFRQGLPEIHHTGDQRSTARTAAFGGRLIYGLLD